jgi:hypothetical protein
LQLGFGLAPDLWLGVNFGQGMLGGAQFRHPRMSPGRRLACRQGNTPSIETFQ